MDIDGVVICKKCGELFGNLGKNEVCPCCGNQLDGLDISELEFCHMSEQEEDELRLKVQPLEAYDQDLWQKRIKYDADYSAQIDRETRAFNATHPECPYCNTRNTKKISAFSKALNTGMFGIFGTKRHYQWHCNNCDSDF